MEEARFERDLDHILRLFLNLFNLDFFLKFVRVWVLLRKAKRRWLSKVARVVLINSSMISLLMYLMGFCSHNESLHQEIAKY